MIIKSYIECYSLIIFCQLWSLLKSTNMGRPTAKKKQPEECNICKACLNSHSSYNKASRERFGQYEHLFNEIGHSIHKQNYICSKCQTLLSSRHKVDCEYKNRNSILKKLRRQPSTHKKHRGVMFQSCPTPNILSYSLRYRNKEHLKNLLPNGHSSNL